MTQQTLQPDAGFRFRSLVLTRTKRPGILVWLALIFALYCLAGSIFLPRWTLPRLEKELSDVFGTDCIIGGLRVNPLTLQITARDIVIPYPEATAQSAGRDFIRLKRLQVRAALSSFTSKTLVIDELRFLGPEIHITRYKDGSLSPQHIFAATNKEEPEAGASTDEDAPASGDDLFPTVIRNLALENGTLTIKDTIHDASYTITGINLSVPFASTLASDRDLALTPKLSAVVGGKPVTITGEVRPFARAQQTVFTLRARELDLSELRAFIAPYTHLTLQSGKLHTALTLRFDLNPEKAFDFSLAGTVEITDLALADKNNTVFKAAHAVVDMENVILGPRRVLINDAVLENPEIAIRRLKNGSIDWSGFFFLPDDAVRSEVHFTTGEGAKIPKPDAAPAGKTEENAAHGLPLQLVVHKVRVTGGKLAWHDSVPESPVSYGAENITATFTDVNTEKDGHAAFTLDFNLADDKASFTASGTMTMSPL
ncbi:MAG: DUF748 domain-containing protein, partial [Deltaproteobacteria bacterium]|nr:DUF748 domain-containing protein [Deltaproteobacteria bacterium]